MPVCDRRWAWGSRVSIDIAEPSAVALRVQWSGVPTTFQVVLPAGNAVLYMGVRAVDRVGNLGAKVRAWKLAGSPAASPPTPIGFSDAGGALVGGMVRAAGRVTGGTGTGDDPLVSNFTAGGTAPST